MTSRILFLSFVMLFGCSVSAQKAFYIRPRTMMKIDNSMRLGQSLSNTQKPLNQSYNGFYTFYNYGLHFTDTKVNLGISAGLRFDSKNALEFVVSADGSSVKNAFIYTSFFNGIESNYQDQGYQDFSSLQWGHGLIRSGLEFHRRLVDKSRFEMRGVFGLGIFTEDNQDVEYLGLGFENKYFSANVERINSTARKNAPYIQLGLGFDWQTKKGVPVLSFDIFATINRWRYLQKVTYNVDLIETDGTSHNFAHSLFSRGSGINFQISRPIQVYPWRPNKKPKTD